LRELGFTLLEMLIKLAIIAVNMARVEALLHGVTVTLCGGRDGVCSGRWRDGQVLFIDAARKGAVQEPGDVLVEFDALRSAELHWRSALAKNYLSIDAAGSTDDEDGTFWYCEFGARSPAWAMRINQAGRARLAYPDRQGRIGTLSC
jgi:prepilin-type N-terminal cleavage/methylation domain-containing protein